MPISQEVEEGDAGGPDVDRVPLNHFLLFVALEHLRGHEQVGALGRLR